MIRKKTSWMPERPENRVGCGDERRAAHQRLVILHPDAEYLPASPKEYGKTGKPAADRI